MTVTTPVVALIAGQFQEQYSAGQSFGHAAAIIGEGNGSASVKRQYLRDAGVGVAHALEDKLGTVLAEDRLVGHHQGVWSAADLLEGQYLEDGAPHVAHELLGGHGLVTAGPADHLAGAHEVLGLEPALQLVDIGAGGSGQVAQGLRDGAMAGLALPIGRVRRAGSEGAAAALHEIDQVLQR